jgi:hypothetical protein
MTIDTLTIDFQTKKIASIPITKIVIGKKWKLEFLWILDSAWEKSLVISNRSVKLKVNVITSALKIFLRMLVTLDYIVVLFPTSYFHPSVPKRKRNGSECNSSRSSIINNYQLSSSSSIITNEQQSWIINKQSLLNIIMIIVIYQPYINHH